MADESGITMGGGLVMRTRDRVPDVSITAADTALRRWALSGVLAGAITTAGVHFAAEIDSVPSALTGGGMFLFFTVTGVVSNFTRRRRAGRNTPQ
jgi:hypothetical protein